MNHSLFPTLALWGWPRSGVYFPPQCLLGPKEWPWHQQESPTHTYIVGTRHMFVRSKSVVRGIPEVSAETVGQGLNRRKDSLGIRIFELFERPRGKVAASRG